MFEQLETGQAVIFGENLLVKLKSGTYSIDGVSVEVGGYRSAPVLVPNNTTVYEIKPSSKKLDGYKLEDGSVLSPQEYRDKETEIFGKYRDEDGYHHYPTTEAKIEALKQWIPYEKKEALYTEIQETLTPVEFNIVGIYEDTGSPFIQSCLQLGRLRHKRGGGVYNVDVASASVEVWEQMADKYKDIKFERDRNYLRFSKINDNFIAYEDFYNEGVYRVFDNLDDAKNYLKYVQTKTKNDILKHIKPLVAPEKSVNDLLKTLKYLEKSVLGLSVYKKSIDAKRGILSVIRKDISDLETYIRNAYEGE